MKQCLKLLRKEGEVVALSWGGRHLGGISQLNHNLGTLISHSLYFTDMCSTYEGSVSQDEQQELTSAPPPPPPPVQPPAPFIRPMDISEADDRIKRFYGERIKCTPTKLYFVESWIKTCQINQTFPYTFIARLSVWTEIEQVDAVSEDTTL